MSNEAFDKFLLKLFEKTADRGQKSYFSKYEIGKEIELFDQAEVDRIVKILHADGFVVNNEVEDSEIRITDKGKKRLENNQI
jgi:DNA-binding PadR family transcriptional regulator